MEVSRLYSVYSGVQVSRRGWALPSVDPGDSWAQLPSLRTASGSAIQGLLEWRLLEPLLPTQVHAGNSELRLSALVPMNLFSSYFISHLPACNIWRPVSSLILQVSVDRNEESVHLN